MPKFLGPLLALLLLVISWSVMANDIKTSAMADGTYLLSTDYVHIARGGADFKAHIGTMGTQNANAVAILGGSVYGLTGLAVGSASLTPGASVDFGSAHDSLLLPTGTTGQRPGTPTVGMLRYNSTTAALEAYAGSSPAWGPINLGALGSQVSVTAADATHIVVSPTPGTGTFTLDIGTAIATAAKNLGFFASTTSAQLFGVISDETGTGVIVGNASPNFTGTVTGAAVTWSGSNTSLNFLATGTDANLLPVGTTGQRPGSPANGMIRYNSTLTAIEGYVNGAWSTISGGLVNLASQVTGILGTTNGGTGSAVGNAYSLYDYPALQPSTHVLFGDSITCGIGAGGSGSCNSNGYANLLTTDEGATINNRGSSGDQVCETAVSAFTNENPGATKNALYTDLIGTNDANVKGAGTYETGVFKGCLSAALSWLTIPSTFKVTAQNAACVKTGSGWLNGPTGYFPSISKYTTNQGDSVACTITTYGGPIEVWYLTEDDWTNSTFSYSVTGGSSGSANSFTTPAVATQHVTNKGPQVLRLGNLAAGSHTVTLTLTSPTGAGNNFLLMGIGTPSPFSYWGAPEIFQGGVLRQQNDANAAATLAYDADVQSVVSSLAADGMRTFFVPVRSYVNSTTDMFDTLHPNTTGHQHLRDAFAAAEQFTPNQAVTSYWSLSGNNIVYSGGSGAILQGPAATNSVANYMRTNNANAASTTNLNPGLLFYGDSGGDFGADLGSSGGVYGTRIFTAGGDNIYFSFHAGGTPPTGQSSFTNAFTLNDNANGPNFLMQHTNGDAVQLNEYEGTTFNALVAGSSTLSATKVLLLASGTSTAFPIIFATDNFIERARIQPTTGRMGIGTTTPNAMLDVNGTSIIIETANTPADNATCTAGQIYWDTGFIYVCTASGTVKRAALSTY
jgi:lysophospholipase L1-like esterase